MSGYDDLTDRTADLMGLCDVHRWNVIKTARTQSVAEHSFTTAVIAMEVMERLGAVVAAELLLGGVVRWALVHDAPETLTGDIDGKFKRDYPEIKMAVYKAEQDAFPWYRIESEFVTPKARAIVKLADTIEAVTFIKMWGVGPRADDVYRELYVILFEESVPFAAGIIGVPVEQLYTVVKHIVDHSVMESNSVQLRRFRTEMKAAAAEL